MTTTVTYHVGDVRDVMAGMDDGCVDLIATSPPFLALREYLPSEHADKHREIGAEPTPAEFLDTMMGLTTDWRRLLAAYGSLCVEFGDTYSGSGGHGGDYNDGGLREGQPKFKGSGAAARGDARGKASVVGSDGKAYGNPPRQKRNRAGVRRDPLQVRGDDDGEAEAHRRRAAQKRDVIEGWPLGKSLTMVPELYAASLAYGRNLLNPALELVPWRVRNFMTWTRPNPPVGSLGKINTELATGDQRFRQGTSFVTVACTGRHRWFDLEAVRRHNPRSGESSRTREQMNRGSIGYHTAEDLSGVVQNPAGAPPLDWWDANDIDDDELDEYWRICELLEDEWQPFHRMSSSPYPGQHYATFPVALPRRLVEAMCPLEVCRSCGIPRLRRVTAAAGYDDLLGASWADRSEGRGKQNGAPRSHHAGQPVGVPHITSAAYETLGWTDCGHGDYRPGVALDPFGGSGTTGVAAALAGRDAVLIDIDARNVDLCRRRLHEQVLVVDERVVGDTVVWTVNAKMPGTRGQAPGQQSLFA